MCGISVYFAREAKPYAKSLLTLLEHAEDRGTDACGYVTIGRDRGFYSVTDSGKSVGKCDLETISETVSKYMDIGDIFLSNHRAAPETEAESTDSTNIQPIIDELNGLILVHNGSVSKFIYDELKVEFPEPVSALDSEAIIWAYLLHGRNMKRTMEYLSGGFSFILIDLHKESMYAVATHNPLYCGYVRGHGLFFSSSSEGVYSTISGIKGVDVKRNNIMMWEDYYCQELPANVISEFDLQSGIRNEVSFTPRYIHPHYDPLKSSNVKECVLIAASGGLDSSTTMAVLKASGLDVHAVHFKYGHRGGDCEEHAIKRVCEVLDIPIVTFDLSDNMALLDSNSMLTNSDEEITTGTDKGLKATVAWTCFRNGFFTTYMGALAEKMIINDGYNQVHITGGFMNLTESGVYPDNSERFIKSFSKFANFASIVGTKIHPMYACANLLKAEQYIILDKLGLLEELGPELISCDRPKMIDGKPHNCSKDGKPACGSGLLSYWASKYAGVEDNRRYYEVDDENYVAYEPDSDFNEKKVSMETILKKIQIPSINVRILQRKLL